MTPKTKARITFACLSLMCQLSTTFKLSHWESPGLGHIEINGLSKPSQHYGLKPAETDGLPVDGLGFGFRFP